MNLLLAEQYLLIIVRVLITSLLVVYNIFAFLMSRQIGLMTRAVSMKDSSIIIVFGYAHLAFAVVVLLMALLGL